MPYEPTVLIEFNRLENSIVIIAMKRLKITVLSKHALMENLIVLFIWISQKKSKRFCHMICTNFICSILYYINPISFVGHWDDLHCPEQNNDKLTSSTMFQRQRTFFTKPEHLGVILSTDGIPCSSHHLSSNSQYHLQLVFEETIS